MIFTKYLKISFFMNVSGSTIKPKKGIIDAMPATSKNAIKQTSRITFMPLTVSIVVK
jgi:hypothetical protein